MRLLFGAMANLPSAWRSSSCAVAHGGSVNPNHERRAYLFGFCRSLDFSVRDFFSWRIGETTRFGLFGRGGGKRSYFILPIVLRRKLKDNKRCLDWCNHDRTGTDTKCRSRQLRRCFDGLCPR